MYHLMLTDGEVKTLGWCADRGYFPKEIYDEMSLAIGEEDKAGNTERKWEFPEHAAWELTELSQFPDAYLACIGGDLLDKIVKLECQIV